MIRLETGFYRWLVRLFDRLGPQRTDDWEKLALQYGGSFVKLDYKHKILRIPYKGWHLTIEGLLIDYGDKEKKYTNIYVPFNDASGYELSINLSIGASSGQGNIRVGDPTFDHYYFKRSNDRDKTRRLFSNDDAKEQILREFYFFAEIKPKANMAGKVLPQGTNLLSYKKEGLVKKRERLLLIMDAVVSMMNALKEADSAISSYSVSVAEA